MEGNCQCFANTAGSTGYDHSFTFYFHWSSLCLMVSDPLITTLNIPALKELKNFAGRGITGIKQDRQK
jgi:hypothetical protein